jgi:hypothetical protein
MDNLLFGIKPLLERFYALSYPASFHPKNTDYFPLATLTDKAAILPDRVATLLRDSGYFAPKNAS